MKSKQGLYGLILTGGESSRMGEPKYLLDYHGMSQVNYLSQLLEKYCDDVFISCSPEQSKDPALPKKGIVDEIQFQHCGPMGGLLSAFNKVDGAFLMVGCDYPYFQEIDLMEILDSRDPSHCATVFLNPEQQLPEPFPGIYELKSKLLLMERFAQKQYSLRSFLTTVETKLVIPTRPNCLISVDTREAFEEAKRKLKNP
ncbi:hypothetical protein BH11BAC2_BH11BAC2_05820 [soil metagenome]